MFLRGTLSRLKYRPLIGAIKERSLAIAESAFFFRPGAREIHPWQEKW